MVPYPESGLQSWPRQVNASIGNGYTNDISDDREPSNDGASVMRGAGGSHKSWNSALWKRNLLPVTSLQSKAGACVQAITIAVHEIDAATHKQGIHLTSTDAFAVKNSNLSAFLYGAVGTEMNGSLLTMLSVLVRLGQDPWAEAARWTELAKHEAFGCLGQNIRQIPLDGRSRPETNALASRLLLVPPGRYQSAGQTIPALAPGHEIQGWAAVAFLCASRAAMVPMTISLCPRPTTMPCPRKKKADLADVST